jgi:hypothetical protein
VVHVKANSALGFLRINLRYMLLSMFETHTSSLDLYSPVMNLPRCSSLYSVKFADIGSHVGRDPILLHHTPGIVDGTCKQNMCCFLNLSVDVRWYT